jgi:hypothetical protein
MGPRALAEAIARGTRALRDASLRVSYLTGVLGSVPVPELARGLDVLCARAEQAEEPAREVLLSLVDALQSPHLGEVVQRLREEAAGESLLALERLVRQPTGTRSAFANDADAASTSPLSRPLDPGAQRSQSSSERVPDYGRGRPLTLGERKSLARRSDRAMLDRLLHDPHPDVIQRLLRNPRLTEDDVVRLAARRPGRPDVLAEIVRWPRWIHCARVRLAVILNPDTPPEIAAPISGLLMRQELRLVAEATQVSAAVRALCLEHLERRPPSEKAAEGEPIQ